MIGQTKEPSVRCGVQPSAWEPISRSGTGTAAVHRFGPWIDLLGFGVVLAVVGVVVSGHAPPGGALAWVMTGAAVAALVARRLGSADVAEAGARPNGEAARP